MKTNATSKQEVVQLTTDLNNVNNLKMLLETELNNNKTLLMEKEQALAVVSDTVTQAMERATQSELAQATATNELVLGKSWFTVVVVVVQGIQNNPESRVTPTRGATGDGLI